MPNETSDSEAAAGSSGKADHPDGAAPKDCTACLLTGIGTLTHNAEVCGNGVDDDGDGVPDNGCPCDVGATQRCFRGDAAHAGVGACTWGKQHCSGDKSSEFRSWGECTAQGERSDERCDDGIDNDCDGAIDEDCGCKEGEHRACSNACGAGEQTCKDHAFGKCSARSPSAELCNGVDDDCDGTVDNLPPESCSNACGSGQRSCVDGSWSACSAPKSEAESCNGIDDDCDGTIDNIADKPCTSACGSGRQRCENGRWSSCSAPSPTVETCNGKDDDCDGRVDDIADQACSSACGSGVRSCLDGKWSSCSAPAPKTETCNGRDDDCDGTIDDGLTASWSFESLCHNSRIFVALSGCNVCSGSCNGHWVDPGDSYTVSVEQDSCFTYSAFARTSKGDVCLDSTGDTGDYVGETRKYCNGDCKPTNITMGVRGGC